jgi:hypothetical protein
MYVLLITNELNGQTEVVNKLFSSQQEAQQYVNENHLILQKIMTLQEYQTSLQNYQNQKLMRQYYQRPQPQQQYPNQVQTIQEQEPVEQSRPVRPPKPVFIKNYNPGRAPYFPVRPLFVLNKKKR